jgi:hypothetical protein
MKDYKIISQSIFRGKNSSTLQSDFVTTETMDLQKITQKTLGRVNQYCTTSYWAPLLHLMNYVPKNSLIHFKNTKSFQDLLFEAAENKVDGATVWDIIIDENPNAARKVYQIFSVNNLPTPVIVAKPNFSDVEILEKINRFKTEDKTGFFAGFQKPNDGEITEFLSAIQQAIKFYNLSLSL